MTHLTVAGPLGPLTLFERDGRLVAVEWGWSPADGDSPLLRTAETQLAAYFDGELQTFDLPLAPAATPFQAALRTALLAIPYGQATTYQALARALKSSPRAVGQACARNPLPIVVPCHRVLTAAGDLGGYSGGGGLAGKRALLTLEGYLPAQVGTLEG